MIGRKSNVVRDAILKLIPALWGKPRIAAIMYAMLVEIQVLEDAIWNGINARLIDNATGIYLATLGELVGQPNLGPWTEDVYRLYIKARIRANRSLGKIRDLLDVATVVSDLVGYRDIGNGVFQITVNSTIPQHVQAAVQAAAAAGVRVSVVYADGPQGWRWNTPGRTFSRLDGTGGGLLQGSV